MTVARAPGERSAADLLATGEAVSVVIVQSQPLGMKNPEGVDLHAMLLTVVPDGEAPYQVQVGNPVPAEALPLLHPGSKVPARRDPAEPNAVVVDWATALAGA